MYFVEEGLGRRGGGPRPSFSQSEHGRLVVYPYSHAVVSASVGEDGAGGSPKLSQKDS